MTHAAPLLALLVAAGAASEPPKVKRPDWMVWTPSQVHRLYDKNELAAEAELAPRARVVGLVDRVERDLLHQPMVTLQSGDLPPVVCRLRKSSVTTAAKLERGDLVAISGRGIGRGIRGANFVDCDVTWVFRPDDQAVKIGSLGLARSSERCITQTLGPAAEAANDQEMKTAAKTMRKTADEDLKAANIRPLECTHPLVSLVFMCEQNPDDSPECELEAIANARTQLQRATE